VQPIEEWLNRAGGLAWRLRDLRMAAGLTGERLAAQVGWDRTKVSKLENGRQMPSREDITAWTQATGHPEVAPELLDMLAEGRAIHQHWKHQLRKGHPTLQTDFDSFVRNGTHIRNFEIMLIPGLVQTPDYARHRALEAVRLHGTDPDKVDEFVAARMRRQSVLYDTSKRFEFIITQAALDYLLCPADVMTGQIDRLTGLIGMGHVTFGIIPSGVVLAIAPMLGYLMVDDVTVVETFSSSDTLTGEESAKYGEIFAELMAQAVTGDEARRLLTAAAVRLAR
jgi:transcriptional regulator with XRE-family HTH domain